MTCNGELQLVNNGYEGLVVAISEDVPEEHCNHLIYGLQRNFLHLLYREFSSQLWSLTGSRASLRNAIVAIPNSWRTENSGCSFITSVTPFSTPESHILITTSHPVFGSRPWVHQTRACGQPGDYIEIGESLLRSIANDTYNFVAKLLTAEWVKFRWGTFEEKGFPGDPLYPSKYRNPFTGSFQPNTCTDYRNPLVPICPYRSHTPEAPTKHNAQCQGKAAWDVVYQSQDFADGRNSPSTNMAFFVPTLKFVQEKAVRLVLVVEDTNIMNIQERWEFVRKALRRVVVYDVPDDTYVAIVIFNSVAKTTAPLMKLESFSDIRQKIGSSLPRNPSTVPESYKCIKCGFREAMRILTTDSFDAAGANIILVTTGNPATHHKAADEMLELALKHRVKVDTIIYPQTEHRAQIGASNGLESLVANTKGNSFTVMDEGVGKDSKLNMMVALMDALFSSVCASSSQTATGSPVIIHSKYYPGGTDIISEGSFNVDDSFGPAIRFLVFYYDLNHVGNTLQLTSSSGQIIDAINMQEDGDSNAIFFFNNVVERGVWKYQIENRADSHQGLHVQVTGTESAVRKVRLKVWTNGPHAVINMTEQLAPVIIYAEIKDGNLPILNAKVKAKLQRLGNDISGSSYITMVFDLFDHGLGDPDITGDDGVYSRYLPTMYGSAGYYQLSVTADDNYGHAYTPVSETLLYQSVSEKLTMCCGSKIRYENTQKVTPFHRSVVYGVLDVVSIPPSNDNVPPNRVLDLQASVNQTNGEVQLHWTAPGDDNDWGRANHYEINLATSWSMAKHFEGEYLQSIPIPAEVGTKQQFSLIIEEYDRTLYLAMRGVDELGNRGDVSNIVMLWVPRPLTTAQTITTPQYFQSTDNDAKPYEQEVTEKLSADGITIQDLFIITASTGGFIVIMVAIATSCHCFVSRRKYHHKTDIVTLNPSLIIKTNSTTNLKGNDRQHDSDSDNKEKETSSRIFHKNSLVSNTKFPGESTVVTTLNISPQHCFPDVTLTSDKLCTDSSTSTYHICPNETSYINENYNEYLNLQDNSFPSNSLNTNMSLELPTSSAQVPASYKQRDYLTKAYAFPYGEGMIAYNLDTTYPDVQAPNYVILHQAQDSCTDTGPPSSPLKMVTKETSNASPNSNLSSKPTTVVSAEVFVDSKNCNATHV
ncbi:hypothetical protein SK128_005677 [Halocaridina rubra]|uniref:Calcium-activated chloride channel N-terminal domain-containing protein n=1 Tax=Halocaridina rubra TaxID=373956 RepID=A0AAN8X0X3_HALRR